MKLSRLDKTQPALAIKASVVFLFDIFKRLSYYKFGSFLKILNASKRKKDRGAMKKASVGLKGVGEGEGFKIEPEVEIFEIPACNLNTEQIRALISSNIDEKYAWYVLYEGMIEHDQLGRAPKNSVKVKYVKVAIDGDNENGFVKPEAVRETIIRTGLKLAPAIFFMICEKDNFYIPSDAENIISLELAIDNEGRALYFDILGSTIHRTKYVHNNDYILCIVED